MLDSLSLIESPYSKTILSVRAITKQALPDITECHPSHAIRRGGKVTARLNTYRIRIMRLSYRLNGIRDGDNGHRWRARRPRLRLPSHRCPRIAPAMAPLLTGKMPVHVRGWLRSDRTWARHSLPHNILTHLSVQQNNNQHNIVFESDGHIMDKANPPCSPYDLYKKMTWFSNTWKWKTAVWKQCHIILALDYAAVKIAADGQRHRFIINFKILPNSRKRYRIRRVNWRKVNWTRRERTQEKKKKKREFSYYQT